MAKNVTITLTVAAASLFPIQNPNQSQVDQYCGLSDDNAGSSPNGTLEDFETNVYIDNDVSWVGVSSDPGYTVSIDNIVYEDVNGDVDFFKRNIVCGSGGRSGNVTVKVKNDQQLINKIDTYRINFSIYDSPSDFKTYAIDPKLKGNT